MRAPVVKFFACLDLEQIFLFLDGHDIIIGDIIMIISIDWIKDYVNLPDLDARDLAEKITLAVCEVEKVITRQGENPQICFEIDNKSITHRPDLWGHDGMAREFAAVLGVPLKNPHDQTWRKKRERLSGHDPSPVSISVETGAACAGFYGVSMDHITVGQSPGWMKARLKACGVRAVNNIVDISNYVMLETGMPLHIFDRDIIQGGRIIARCAGKDGKITTLDGLERRLEPDDTLVCDAQKPLSIAGVMGGLNSAVTSKTGSIFIEAANWDSVRIRKTSVRLSLRTDAAIRYEKKLDSQQLEKTIWRAIALVHQVCPDARIEGRVETGGLTPEDDPVVIDITAAQISRTLGKKISTERIIQILSALDFTVQADHGRLSIRVPSYRATKDIQCRADIIEEIGRIVGYGTIPPVSPTSRIEPVGLSPEKKLERKIRDFLVLSGRAFEIITYPMVGRALLEKAGWPDLNEALKLANPLSEDSDRMRPSLIPSMLEKAGLNAKRHETFRIFEIGRAYLPAKAFSREVKQLVACFYNRAASPFIDLADVVQELLRFINIKADLIRPCHTAPNGPQDANWSGYHPVEMLEIQCGKMRPGLIFSLHPNTLREFGMRGNLAMLCLDITHAPDLVSTHDPVYRPVSPYPSSTFDCTVLTGTRTYAEDVLRPLYVLKKKSREIESIQVVDVFARNDRQKTLTLRISFNGEQKTLTGAWLKTMADRIVMALQQAGFPLRE